MRRLLLCTIASVLLVPGAARAASSPPLTVPPDRLAAALTCEGDPAAAAVPVLLVPGTGEDPDFFDTNYKPALRKLGRPFCAVTLPDHATGDIQTAAEYLVAAIRTLHERAGRRIAVIGHSQGGMVPRWALKFFPDTRAMVDDLVGLAASNHGTTAARGVCVTGCSAATWQQRDDSAFVRALNAGGETFAGVSYTSVFTHLDEIVTPNADASTGSTALRTGDGARANIATQDICPANTADHLVLGSTDPVGYALTVDALTHPGAADPARVDRAACAQVAQPGVSPATGLTDTTAAFAKVITQFTGGAILSAEPPLRCYAGGPCPAGTATGAPGDMPAAAPAPAQATRPRPRPRLFVSAGPRHVRAGRRATVRVLVRAVRSGRLVPVAGATVRLAGARARTGADGTALVRKRFVASGARTVRATRSGFAAGDTRVTVRVR